VFSTGIREVREPRTRRSAPRAAAPIAADTGAVHRRSGAVRDAEHLAVPTLGAANDPSYAVHRSRALALHSARETPARVQRASASRRRAKRPDPQRHLLAREGEVVVGDGAGGDELAPCLELVLLPVRIVEVFVEHDDGPGLQALA
jgi:hypothetical protein